MKPISRKKEKAGRSQIIALIAFLFTLSFGANLPALADIGSDTDLVTGSGNITDTNKTNAGDTVANSDKRWKFMADIRKSDTLKKISGSGDDSKAGTNLQESEENTTPQIGPAPAAQLVIPNYTNGFYYQPLIPEVQVPHMKKDTAIFHNLMTTFGYPISDTQYQMIARENGQRNLEMRNDPELKMWQKQNEAQLQGASASNSIAGASQTAFQNMTTDVSNGPGSAGGEGGAGGGSGAMGALINIANENAGTPTASDSPWKPVSGAVWMVQQMYKFVFVPMAILFLLPGAVLTQVKGQVASGILGQQAPSPFEGILRAMIAVFLIPSTQLIMSYAIDVGNSLTYTVNDYVDMSVITAWSQQTIYNVPVQNVDNAIKPPPGTTSGTGQGGQQGGNAGNSIISGADSFISSSFNSMFGSSIGGAAASLITPGLNSALSGLLSEIGIGALNPLQFGSGGDGLGVDTPENKTIQERQLWLSQTMELVLNSAIYLFSIAVLVLGAFQLVFMCYLFLLGPLAAAFFAWPVISGSSASAPNSNVFSGWVDAVIVVSLWRFFWMVILAIMTQRILWMMDTGQKLNLQWEVSVFICLLGLMLYVPFHPWDYDPGKAFTQAVSAGQQLAQSGGGAAAGAASAAGVPQSQINAVGNAFNNFNQAAGPLVGNQQQTAQDQLSASGKTGAAAATGQGRGQETGTPPPPANPGQQRAEAQPQAQQRHDPPSPTHKEDSQPVQTAALTADAKSSTVENPKANPTDQQHGKEDQQTQVAAANQINGGDEKSDPPSSTNSTETRESGTQVASNDKPVETPGQQQTTPQNEVAQNQTSPQSATPAQQPPPMMTAQAQIPGQKDTESA